MTTTAGLSLNYLALKVSTATRCHTTSKAPVARSSNPLSLKSLVRTSRLSQKSSFRTSRSSPSWRRKVSTRGPLTSSKLSVKPQLSKCSSPTRESLTLKKLRDLLQVSTQSMISTNHQRARPRWASCQSSIPLITRSSSRFPLRDESSMLASIQRMHLLIRITTPGPYKSFLKKVPSLTSLQG